MKVAILILLFFSSVILGESEPLKCDAEALPKYRAENFRPIRLRFIHWDSSLSSSWVSPLTSARFNAFYSKIIQPAEVYLSKLLKVYPVNETERIEANCQTDHDGDLINVDVNTHISGYDFVFYVAFKEIASNAESRYCALHKFGGLNGYRRPVAGVIYFNTNLAKNFEKWTAFETAERRRTLLHEMTHTMAFDPLLSLHYINETCHSITVEETVDGVSYISHPLMKKLVEDYFNCKGDENHGLALDKKKAHFSHQLIANTMMRPVSDNFVDRLSIVYVSLFSITGWYIVDTELTEETLWGRGKGCKFANLQCEESPGKTFDEYCDMNAWSENSDGCDYYYEAKSTCEMHSKTQCTFYNPHQLCTVPEHGVPSSSFEYFGVGSKCFEYHDHHYTSPACLKATCQGTSIIVTSASGVVITSDYSLGSPNPATFKIGDIEFSFPKSFNRFCFNIFNPNKEMNKRLRFLS